ncbi:MAG: formylglycine-generating enzyme family protein [Pirellulaceae bacterium]|nr:formylglycine-generating enzyme family protein [Pirellulaceae bacterium]MDP6723122.1 formylglycine-generating enzyme family protein [Pirellulaceae bacterium]
MILNSWIRRAASVAHRSFASILALDLKSEFSAPSFADADKDRCTTGEPYCATLVANPPLDVATRVAAWKTLEERTGLVPAGETRLAIGLESSETWFAQSMDQSSLVSTGAFYLDRYAVTNDQFFEFVTAGGYNQQKLWPPKILPRVLQFVDQTGHPSPKWWSAGKPPAHKRNHPVVGISWFEANAYARWSGQRLPTAAEWQQAASWFSDGAAGEARYPWGDSFDPNRANTWHSRHGDTVPVDEYSSGSTPNGICQLIGNTWEWTADGLDGGDEGSSRIIFERTHAEIRGGAYDTYLETQATCQFRTGQPLLYRGTNIGFRCCIAARDLPNPPDPSALLEIREL